MVTGCRVSFDEYPEKLDAPTIIGKWERFTKDGPHIRKTSPACPAFVVRCPSFSFRYTSPFLTLCSSCWIVESSEPTIKRDWAWAKQKTRSRRTCMLCWHTGAKVRAKGNTLRTLNMTSLQQDRSLQTSLPKYRFAEPFISKNTYSIAIAKVFQPAILRMDIHQYRIFFLFFRPWSLYDLMRTSHPKRKRKMKFLRASLSILPFFR